MIIADTNVWAALAIPHHLHHQPATSWFDGVDDDRAVSFCRPTQQGFLRLVTRRAAMVAYGAEPLTNAEAWQLYDNVCEDDRVGPLIDEPPDLEQVWRRWSSRSSASPQLWTDAYLAAFAITAGATLVTIDRAFTQFPALDLHLIG